LQVPAGYYHRGSGGPAGTGRSLLWSIGFTSLGGLAPPGGGGGGQDKEGRAQGSPSSTLSPSPLPELAAARAAALEAKAESDGTLLEAAGFDFFGHCRLSAPDRDPNSDQAATALSEAEL